VTVKRVANGEVSRYLIDHLKVGDVISCLPPSGKFLLEEGVERTHVFVAAGSGMTPVFSLIREALYRRPAEKLVLITQNRDSGSILFRSSLEELARLFPARFRWMSLLSSVGGGTAGIGRLNNALLTELLDSMEIWVGDKRPFFYLCGPPGFMRMTVFTLRLLGVPDREIRRENFVVEYVPPPPVLRDTSPREVVLHVEPGKVVRFATHWPSTILQSALDNGIALPYSCKGGRCGTCAARCISGKVRMTINEVLSEKDLQEGLVLTCVGYAETDVELVLQ
ncbi:MAG: iron-sulfur cluster-binding domain-containing protein, partial [Bacteroidetes bacterium]|nr:iron-sulfur cluster-binding domain-containing protein [Bacteroidota bacterium]